MADTLFGLKRLETANIIFFSFYIQTRANREALQASNTRRHEEAEERKERQQQAANEGGQADDNSLPATEPNTSHRNRQQKQPKPISRKRRIYYIALIDNNFGIGNLFLTLDLSNEVIDRAERKLAHISKNTYYKYRAELLAELNGNDGASDDRASVR